MRPGMIDVTGVPLEALLRAAYNPSRPQGLGHLHYQPLDLSDEDVAGILKRGETDRLFAIYTDYVRGRSMKFKVRKHEGRHFLENRWYDHGDSELRALLVTLGLSADLVDKARAEEGQYYAGCIAAAIAFLKDRGGEYVEKRDEQLPDAILTGLIHGSDPGPTIKREWVDDGCRYSLADE